MLTAKLVIENSASGIGWNEAEPATEKRAAPRFTLLIRTAKLIAPGGEFFCVVRDASSDEMSARVFLPVPVPEDTPLIVEFGNGERLPVIKIWQDGDVAGFRFVESVAIDRLLADAPEGLRKRSVRLRLALPVTLTVAGRSIPATYRDISQHGACLHCEERLPVNARIELASAILPSLEAHVRWRRAPLYGVIFTQAFRFDDLARLTASLHYPADKEVALSMRA